MKPPPFNYHAPASVGEALELLSSLSDAKVLAGGQSLVPSMNFRLARPGNLIDINRLSDLSYVREEQGWLAIGALTRHVDFESTSVPDPLGALLRTIAHQIGHLPIRVRGTFVGSVAHADPAAEWCLLAVTLDAEMVCQSVDGTRVVGSADFFDTVFTTALEPSELLVEVRIPLLDPETRVGFQEFSRRAGDFAIVMALTALEVEGERIEEARIGLGGVSGAPVRAQQAEELLVGEPLSEEAFAEAARVAASEVEPWEDIHGSVEYRKDLIRALTRRALAQSL
jgi:carbon-monoxide dehydrogenase medium subunit